MGQLGWLTELMVGHDRTEKQMFWSPEGPL